MSPFVTWGTNPGQGVPLAATVPDPELMTDDGERQAAEKALAYMDLRPGMPMRDIAVDAVFVGSCTNGRIEDLRVVADVLRGRKVAQGVRMLVVPGSMRVRAQAEAEGLGEIFTAAGAEWRQAGCSMCLGMNPDQLAAGRALRLDVQPQLRRAPGQGRPHAFGVSGRRRRHGRSRHPVRPGRPELI